MHEVSLNFVLGNYLSWLLALVPPSPFFVRKGEGSLFIYWRSDVLHHGYVLVKPHSPDHRHICFIHLANNYSKILLNQLSWDQTGARLLDILGYQMVPILF
jgi:hypothetical protein